MTHLGTPQRLPHPPHFPHRTSFERDAAVLRAHGLKATKQRAAILRLFAGAGRCQPRTMAHIAHELAHASLDRATIYRTVVEFEKKKILRRVNLHTTATHYELALSTHHHHHVICTHCGLTESFDGAICTAADLSKKILKSSRRFSAITQHSLELFGVCKRCIKNN